MREGRHLLESELWSLHPAECVTAARVTGVFVIFMLPAGRICIDQQLAESVSRFVNKNKEVREISEARVIIDNNDKETEEL